MMLHSFISFAKTVLKFVLDFHLLHITDHVQYVGLGHVADPTLAD